MSRKCRARARWRGASGDRAGDPAGTRPDLARDTRHGARRRHLRAIRARDLQPGDRARHSGPGEHRRGSIRRAVALPCRGGPDALADVAITSDRGQLMPRAGSGLRGWAMARGAVLAIATPGLDSGPAGTEARRVDRAGLAPSQAWRSVGLDLQTWPSGPGAPPLLRGVSLSTDALAHDLATSPDLDALVAARPHRGLLLTIDGESLGSRAHRGGGAAPRVKRSRRHRVPILILHGPPFLCRSRWIGAIRSRCSGPERKPARGGPKALVDGIAPGGRSGRP